MFAIFDHISQFTWLLYNLVILSFGYFGTYYFQACRRAKLLSLMRKQTCVL